MASPEKFLRVSTVVFKVLAWLTLALYAVSGTALVVTGGPPVPLMGIDVPARLFGFVYVLAGGVNFYFLWLVRSVIQMLLEIRGRLPGGSSQRTEA